MRCSVREVWSSGDSCRLSRGYRRPLVQSLGDKTLLAIPTWRFTCTAICSTRVLCISMARWRYTEDASALQGAGLDDRNEAVGDKDTRKPRADAVRNRERVLEAAKAVFSAGGPEASLEAVARAAGVGIGTLYRHFPTREALFEAVYRREVEQLADLAEQLKRTAAARRCAASLDARRT